MSRAHQLIDYDANALDRLYTRDTMYSLDKMYSLDTRDSCLDENLCSWAV